eukprot:CAMPEP_0171325676 /NCGR_PEP_ID=MMETSP0816-20121228/116961_1 /TAXON_ID=420281 /ORGANISM="Proboscia inermis, Strain CCAP1064/1" /LENGTH=46 /DNA_ID= /DNA_START= /DNA_END= /DNA_ORIENTATION=
MAFCSKTEQIFPFMNKRVNPCKADMAMQQKPKPLHKFSDILEEEIP